MNENCLICEEQLTFKELTYNFISCFHGFCNDCYYNYFKEKINNNEIEDIKCPQKDCNIIIYNDFLILKIVNDIPLFRKIYEIKRKKTINT